MKDSKPKTDLWILLGTILVIAVLIIGLTCHAIPSSDTEGSTEPAAESAEESEDLEEENAETADSASSEAGSTYEEDQVLYDQDGIVIASTGESSLTEDAWQYGLIIENSSGKDMELTAEYGSINGYMIDLSLSCEAPSGSETAAELEAGLDDLEEAGIETVMEVEFYVELWDPEESKTVDLAGPITLTTDAYGTESQEYDDSGTLLYEEDGMEIVFRQVEDADSTVYLDFYFENSTGEDISITIEDLLINDYSVSGNLLCSITDGKKALDQIALSYDVLSGCGIKQADEIVKIEVNFSLAEIDSGTVLAETGILSIYPEIGSEESEESTEESEVIASDSAAEDSGETVS